MGFWVLVEKRDGYAILGVGRGMLLGELGYCGVRVWALEGLGVLKNLVCDAAFVR